MSILVVQALPQGLIFGADRYVTTTRTSRTPNTEIIQLGQSERPKVLRWPNNKAIIGYVGQAIIGEKPTDEWLYDFIGENFEFESFQELAEKLKTQVEEQRKQDEGSDSAETLIIHLGGFEEREGEAVPVIWFVRNAYGMDPTVGSYQDIRKEYLCSEEFWRYFPTATPITIREELRKKADSFDPFWFHQGIDLGTFNTIETFLRAGFRTLAAGHPGHASPKTLEDYEKHLKMSILTYGSYFEAFGEPGEYYVGGGVDTVKLAWPA